MIKLKKSVILSQWFKVPLSLVLRTPSFRPRISSRFYSTEVWLFRPD